MVEEEVEMGGGGGGGVELVVSTRWPGWPGCTQHTDWFQPTICERRGHKATRSGPVPPKLREGKMGDMYFY